MRKEFIPTAFESCPEEFRKIRLIAERLLKWELLEVECFGTEECSARQDEIEKEFPGFLDDDVHAGQAYWVNPYQKLIRRVDKFNPFISLDDAFLILTRMRDYGTWTLEFPDRDNARATFKPTPSQVSGLTYKPFTLIWPTSYTFICCSLQNSITTVAFKWLRDQIQPSLFPEMNVSND
jgi:hypothetical protein